MVIAVGERRVAALIPLRTTVSAPGSAVGNGGRLPVVELPALPQAGSLWYGLARVDGDGGYRTGPRSPRYQLRSHTSRFSA